MAVSWSIKRTQNVVQFVLDFGFFGTLPIIQRCGFRPFQPGQETWPAPEFGSAREILVYSGWQRIFRGKLPGELARSIEQVVERKQSTCT